MIIRGIAFDAYGTLLDVHAISALAEDLFPQHGYALSALWRDKQIEYTRLLTMSGRYQNFWTITQNALQYSCKALELNLNDIAQQKLMDAYAELVPFEENIAVLDALKNLGLPLAVLTNANPEMINKALVSCHMASYFEHILSADTVQKFKPVPDIYQLGPDALQCSAEEIVFVSSNAWDIVGATWFGYSPFWVNRAQAPMEMLDVMPKAEGETLRDLLSFVQNNV